MSGLGVRLALAVCGLLVAFAGGWASKSLQVAHTSEREALVTIEQSKAKTEEAGKAVSEVAKDYHYEKVHIGAGVLPVDYSLRVKQCGHLPSNAGTTTGTNGETEKGTKPNGTGEVDFTNVAREIESIGLDLESANLQIEYLQKLVLEYKNSCK